MASRKFCFAIFVLEILALHPSFIVIKWTVIFLIKKHFSVDFIFYFFTCFLWHFRLVLRRHYPLAIKICDYLKMSKREGASRVLAHWACHKASLFLCFDFVYRFLYFILRWAKLSYILKLLRCKRISNIYLRCSWSFYIKMSTLNLTNYKEFLLSNCIDIDARIWYLFTCFLPSSFN